MGWSRMQRLVDSRHVYFPSRLHAHGKSELGGAGLAAAAVQGREGKDCIGKLRKIYNITQSRQKVGGESEMSPSLMTDYSPLPLSFSPSFLSLFLSFVLRIPFSLHYLHYTASTSIYVRTSAYKQVQKKKSQSPKWRYYTICKKKTT